MICNLTLAAHILIASNSRWFGGAVLSTIRSLCQSLVGYVILHVFSDGMISLHYRARRSSSAIHSILCTEQSVEKHRFYHWGVRKSEFVNDSCGVAIGIKHRPFPKHSVVNVFSPPPNLQGRGGALRIKCGDADITPIVMYVPPEPNSVKEEQSCKAIWNWVCEVLSALPARTVPILLLDANGKTGLQHCALGSGAAQFFDDGAVGRCDAVMETYNGSLLHSCLFDHHMFAVNTYYNVGPTWYGWTSEGLSSRIDYICLPQSLRSQVESCRILQHVGDALQNMARPGRCDHRPLQVVFEYKLCFDNSPRPTVWNRDLLVQNLAGGSCKESFIGAVEACCADPRYCWDSTVLCPNTMWGQLQQIVHDCATAAFPCDDRLSNRAPVDTMEALQQRREDRLALVQMPRHSMLPFGTCCAGPGSICLQAVSEIFQQWRLAANFRKSDRFVRRLSQRDRRRWLAKHFSIFQDAWQTRQLHDVWKAGRVLSGFRMGPKKRRYDVPSHWLQNVSQYSSFVCMSVSRLSQ